MRLFTPIDVRYAGPIDTRFSVEHTADLNTLLNSGLAYAYMKVVNKEDGRTYELQADMVTWALFTAKGPQGDPGPKGDPGPTGPAITAGTVTLVSGNTPAFEATVNPNTGAMDLKLTLPPYILGEEIPELHTNNKTLVGAINEIYDMISN